MNLVSVKQFADKVGIRHQYIYQLIKSDKLPSLKVAGLRVIDLDNTEIKDYLEKKLS